jgi:hypothetical protein
MDVEQHGAASVAVVGDVDGTTSEIPDKPAIHRSEEEIPLLGTILPSWDVIQDPAKLSGGEVGVYD